MTKRIFWRRAGWPRMGASRLAATSAPGAQAGRRLRRARAKAASPPPAIIAHLPLETSARKLLLVALPPPHFDVGGENHTNARMQTRHYSLCIWKLKFKNRSVSSLCLWFHSWWQDFILVDKSVQFHSCWQDCATKSWCSETTVSAVEDQSENKTIQVHQDWYDFTTTWTCCMLWDQQMRNKATIDGRSNRFHAKLGVFSKLFGSLFKFIIVGAANLAGLMRNSTQETSSLRHDAEESFREWLRLSLVRIAALKKFHTNQIKRLFNASIPPEMRHCNPCRDTQKVSFSPSACLLCLFESANDQQNKRKISRTYIVVARVPTPVQVSISYDLFFVDWLCSLPTRDDDKLRLGKFSVWISAAEFPPVDKVRGVTQVCELWRTQMMSCEEVKWSSDELWRSQVETRENLAVNFRSRISARW